MEDSCPTCGGTTAGSGVCHCGANMEGHSVYDNHMATEMMCDDLFHSRPEPLGSPSTSADQLSTPQAQEGRPRFYWENGPFSHSDLPKIAQDINERMSDEEVRLAILAINTTSTKSAAERRKDSPQHKAKKTREKDLLKAARDLLAQQGTSLEDLTTAYLRSSANSTPQQELEKIQVQARLSANPLAYTNPSQPPWQEDKGVALYCPVCDVEIEGTCAKCGYNGD